MEAKNTFCERFVTVHGILQSGGWGGNEQGKGDFAGQLSPERGKEREKSRTVCVAINSSAARRCGSLRLTNGSFHTTQAEKTMSAAIVFIRGLFGSADDVRETPLTVFTDAVEDSHGQQEAATL